MTDAIRSSEPAQTIRLLIVGFAEAGHMGSYLAAAAARLKLDWEILDATKAHSDSRIVRALCWRFRDRSPARLRRFGAEVLNACVATQRNVVLTTGHAPLQRHDVERLRELGIKVINYSTDDPWNPAMRAEWFLSALPGYAAVFTTRRANMDDLQRCGVRSVHFLPFAYDPEIHRPWSENSPPGAPCDVLFVGGCDADRLPLVSALIEQGLEIALFGGYWDRFESTRPFWRGHANQDVIRAASAAARICLCLVRRANRDGNVMRSFEAAAIGGCILAEDTPDHRALFGPDDHSARYFNSSLEMVQQAKDLIVDAATRRRLSVGLQQRLAHRADTYDDRLTKMLEVTMQHGACFGLADPIRIQARPSGISG